MEVSFLTPIVRYAGTGYNIIRGNPEGNFLRGGSDPGIRNTREVFDHTYLGRKKAYYQGKFVKIPDQINFHEQISCAEQHSENAYSGAKSYAKELAVSVSASGKLACTNVNKLRRIPYTLALPVSLFLAMQESTVVSLHRSVSFSLSTGKKMRQVYMHVRFKAC